MHGSEHAYKYVLGVQKQLYLFSDPLGGYSLQFGQFLQNMFSYTFNVAKYLLAKCEICAQRFSNSTGNLGVGIKFQIN